MTLTRTDRLRLERVVWNLDARLADLPRRARVDRRRETRANLRAAAEDDGAAEAVRGLGDLRHLASGYLAAEYGEALPPKWLTAAGTLLFTIAALDGLISAGQTAYGNGIRSADPHATGAFTWHGVQYFMSATSYAFTDGKYSSSGGAWTPAVYVLLAVLVVCAGRLWRALPRRRQGKAAAAV